MKLLGIDLETTGLDFEKDRIVEIGMVLWDTDLNFPLQLYSELIDENDRPLSEKPDDVTGISSKMIEDYGMAPYLEGCTFWKVFEQYNKEATYIVAHNGNKFDKIMLKDFFDRHKKPFPTTVWLDTLADVEYPEQCKSRNLMYLSAFHGFLNPFPHRALFDVLTMFQILSKYSITEVIHRSLSPTITLQANVSYDNKDKAKEKGFMWNSDKKIWYKELKECDISEDWLNSLDFEVTVL